VLSPVRVTAAREQPVTAVGESIAVQARRVNWSIESATPTQAAAAKSSPPSELACFSF
jgi:hypothetical protein